MALADWMPLFKELVWPIFALVLVVLLWQPLVGLVETVRQRIADGAEVQAGKGGFVLRGEQKETRLNAADERTLEVAAMEAGQARGLGAPQKGRPAGGAAEPVEGFLDPAYVYLTHKASRGRKDRDGTVRHDILAGLDADNDLLLDQVEKVVYHLHPTFRTPVREVRSRENNFAMTTRAWGEFNLFADVFFRGRTEPLRLYRYLNFP